MMMMMRTDDDINITTSRVCGATWWYILVRVITIIFLLLSHYILTLLLLLLIIIKLYIMMDVWMKLTQLQSQQSPQLFPCEFNSTGCARRAQEPLFPCLLFPTTYWKYHIHYCTF